GVLAACGLHALERNVERLAEDHRHARQLADSIAPLAARGLEVTPPETNMVYLSWPGRAPDRYERFVSRLAERGLLAIALPPRGVRLVLHKDIDSEVAAQAAEVLAGELKRWLG
ncbi:MAG: low specificity L-threonine aldolase, partial [Planctomycetes bacterium]|nr:low specificity L-threonine aldolase [Planctomycetota bacterium]